MTFNQLRYFQAVCKAGGVNKAAEVLRISQPSVSNSIKELENELGVILFLRQNKQLSLTKEGHELLKLTDGILSSVDEAVKYMNNLGSKKTLVFGVPPMLSSIVTPILYEEYKSSPPDFKLEIVEGQRGELLDKLEENRINIAILPYEKPFSSKFCFEHIAKIQNVCCVSKTHKFADRHSLSLEELSNEPLVLFKSSFFQTERILGSFSQLGIAPDILLSTVQVSTLQSMLSKGLGAGFVYEFLLKQSPELIGIPLNPPMFTNIALVWKKDGYSLVNIKNFLSFTKQIGRVF